MQREITNQIPLLNDKGELTQPGYARKLNYIYQRDKIKAGSMRIKEWDYYYVGNTHFGVAFTIADNSYMGLISASFLNFDDLSQHTETIMTVLPNGKTNLPPSSVTGDVEVNHNKMQISFKHKDGKRIIDCFVPNFNNQIFKAHLVLSDEPQDSLVIATPFDNHPKHFYYNQKINCLRAEGIVELDQKEYIMDKSDSFGVLDWGRGVWTYNNTWYWSSASGLVEGKDFGFNLGYGFGNPQAATENMLFWQGKAHKLNQVTFEIPKNGNQDDYMKPWIIKDNENRLNLVFTPVLDRAARTNALIIESDQHQVFGKFNGTAVLDDGTTLHLNDLFGFAEKVKNRW